MYKVTNWDTKKVIAQFESLPASKKAARSMGWVVDSVSGIAPVACVKDDSGIVYNPRFTQRDIDSAETYGRR